ncbi:MAG: hypothetical protein JNL11_10610 [Bdellovibrionaceae bacterium]|nr:hypothetical protein [Pseudobdellovibrionaceae bacterium]
MKLLTLYLLFFIGLDFSSASTNRCEAFYLPKKQGRMSQFIPSEVYRKSVIVLVQKELEHRRSSRQSLSYKKNRAAVIGKTALVNLGYYKVLGFVGYLPDIVKLSISRLSDADLHRLSARQNNLSLQEIDRTLKPFHQYVSYFSSVVRWVGTGLFVFTLVANHQAVIGQSILAYEMVGSGMVTKEKLIEVQSQQFSEESVRRQAFQSWKDGFKASVGRDPNPEKYPEDKAEWDFQWRLSRTAAMSSLQNQY